MGRWSRGFGVVLSLVSLGCGRGGAEAADVRRSGRDCEQLRQHLVELRLQSVTLDRDSHRAVIEASLGETFISTCVETMPRKQVRCGRAAKDAAALAACTRP